MGGFDGFLSDFSHIFCGFAFYRLSILGVSFCDMRVLHYHDPSAGVTEHSLQGEYGSVHQLQGFRTSLSSLT